MVGDDSSRSPFALVDTHTHVAERCLLARTVAAIDRGMPILPVEDLLAEMTKAGVERAVLVQWGYCYDHHYLARCLNDHPGRFVAVCHLDQTREDAVDVLRCLVGRYGFGGIRLDSTDRSPGRDALAIWKAAADLDVPVSVSARGSEQFAVGLREVLAHVPSVRLRIEHLGRPAYRGGLADEGFDQIVRMAERNNVYINLDGFYAHHYPEFLNYSSYPFEECLPFVERAVGAFGAQRCMWGSEFPFLNNGYDIGIRFIRHRCSFLRDEDRRRILGGTAVEFWKFPQVI